MDSTRLRGNEALVGGLFSGGLIAACMSSPWTLANVGADPSHAVSAQRYIKLALAAGLLSCAAASFLDRTPWPLIGGAATGAFFWWLYEDAMGQARARGYQGLNTGAS